MKTDSTASDAAAQRVGRDERAVVVRMLTLNMSAKPLIASAASDSANERERPKTTMRAPKTRRRSISVGPARAASGRADEQEPAAHGADGRRAAQEAEAGRARCARIDLREHRQQRDGAAEEHGEEVEQDRAEQDRRAADEADAAEDAARGRRRRAAYALAARPPRRACAATHRRRAAHTPAP